MTQSATHPMFIVQNPDATLAELEQVLRSDDTRARVLLAQRRNCPPVILHQLAQDESDEILYWVGTNPNTPPLTRTAVLWRLAKGDENARCNAAANESAPAALLERLAQDESPFVQVLVLSNPNCPAALREPLLEGAIATPSVHWILVEKYAALTPELMLRLIPDGDEGAAMDLACRQGIPPDVLQALSEHPSAPVRRIVAARPDCPLGVLEALVGDPEARVSVAAALNPQWKGGENFEMLRAMIQLLLEAIENAGDNEQGEEDVAWGVAALDDIMVNPRTPGRARQMILRSLTRLLGDC